MAKIDLGGVKIPKSVAGVKVPKKLRKKGKQLLAKANSPAGREAIAAGLTVVASLAAAKMRAKGDGAAAEQARHRTAKAPTRAGDPGIDRPGDAGQHVGDAIAAGVGMLQQWLAGRQR